MKPSAVKLANSTFRLLVFEVYEPGTDFPLFITSDPSEAHTAKQEIPGSWIVKRHWVREGEPTAESPL